MAKFKRVSIDSLRPGFALRAPIGDPNNPQVKLLAEGADVTQALLDKLKSRGITEVEVSDRDLAMLHVFEPQGRATKVLPAHEYVQSIRVSDESKAMDRLVHEGAELAIADSSEPFISGINRPEESRYPKGLQTQWADENDRHVEQVRELYDQLNAADAVAATPLRQLCEDLLARMQNDIDAFVCWACSPYPAQYPARHAVHLTGLAMAIGTEMKLSHAELIDLGVGCLIHDGGMQSIGLTQFETKSSVTASQLRGLADHPVHTVEIAGRLGDDLSDISRMVAYQIHERLDGSGYPRGRMGNQIHGLSRIAAVADTFVALLTPRPHRFGTQGYHIIKNMLDETRNGKFDPNVVRALLRVTSLYPIGSYVELTNAQVGKVIRSGGSEYERPTIEMWPESKTDQEPVVVNLKQETSIRIVRSIASRGAA